MVTRYAEFDQISLFQPDPPWVYVPKPNDEFLRKNFLPAVEGMQCPNCKNALAVASLGVFGWAGRMMDFVRGSLVEPLECEASLYQCAFCGWWNVSQITTGLEYNERHEMLHVIDLISVHWPKIKSFDLSAAQAPLNELRQAFTRRIPGAVKDTVAGCFRNHFPCEVIQLRKPGVSSMGLLWIQGEHPQLLFAGEQSALTNADVVPVRELISITYTRNCPEAIWISTEERFQTNNVQLPVIQKEGQRVELANYDPLLAVLPESAAPWEKIWRAATGS